MKRNLKSMIGLFVLLLVGVLVFSACGAAPKEDIGTLLLKVNPEIAIRYNSEGLVTQIEGENQDGKELLKDYQDYIGKDSSTVVQELVVRIEEAGYFVADVDSEPRGITLEIQPNSVLPTTDFLEHIVEETKAVTNTMEIKPVITAIAGDGTTLPATQATSITWEQALDIALKHAGLTQEDIILLEADQDRDDGDQIFELEFYHGGMKYDYDIRVTDGSILSFQTKVENPPASSQADTGQANSPLSLAEVQAIAYQDAGVTADEITLIKTELDHDDGHATYEVDFLSGGIKFEYDIDAYSGAILKREQEGKAVDAAIPPAQPQTPETPVAPQTPKTPAAEPPKSSTTEDGMISLERAKAIALEHAGVAAADATFDKAKLDRDDGRLHYEIEFDTRNAEYDYEIDAYSGAILKVEKDSHDDSSQGTSGGKSSLISADKAKSIALSHAGVSASSARFDKVELDYDDGVPHYEIEFDAGHMEYEYEIHAETGAILSYDIDD